MEEEVEGFMVAPPGGDLGEEPEEWGGETILEAAYDDEGRCRFASGEEGCGREVVGDAYEDAEGGDEASGRFEAAAAEVDGCGSVSGCDS